MTTTPEYTRRVIAPTATAEQLAERLTAALVDIHSTYVPLIAASLAAVNAHTGFEVAEQVVADIEYISTASYTCRKQAEGKTRKEAMRALKRHISDAVYQRLIADISV